MDDAAWSMMSSWIGQSNKLAWGGARHDGRLGASGSAVFASNCVRIFSITTGSSIRNDLPGPTAGLSGLDIDAEDPLEALRRGHRSTSLGRRRLVRIPLSRMPATPAPLGWRWLRYWGQTTVVGVGKPSCDTSTAYGNVRYRLTCEIVVCPRKLRRRYVDDGLRHRIIEAQAVAVDFVTAAARAAAVFADALARVLGLCRRLCFSSKQALLVCIEQDLLLGLAAEDLPLEAREVCPELAVLGLKSGDADRCRIGCAYGVNCLFRLRNDAADFTMPIARWDEKRLFLRPFCQSNPLIRHCSCALSSCSRSP